MKIGELAHLTGCTKRTIDYYTTIGLLKAERSASNYRYYTTDSIEKLRLIDKYKKQNMSLDEIKKKFILNEDHVVDLDELKVKLQSLEKDVSEIVEMIQKKQISKDELIKKHLSHESFSLIQSLLLLLM